MTRALEIRVSLRWCAALAGVLAILRLADLVEWSWWWVLAPLWLPVAVLLAAPVLVAALLLLHDLLVGRR